MTNSKLFAQLLSKLEENLALLPDKPEETHEVTLKSLWLKAQGKSISAERAVHQKLSRLNAVQENLVKELLEKRIEGVPLAHITGRQLFMGIELITNSKALIPRKETEILGNFAVKSLSNITGTSSNSTIVFDVCCGAGNLAIAIAKNEPNIKVYASDLSEEAVSLTNENIHFHKLENQIKAFSGDLLEPFEKEEFYNKVDLIVCNPPYISNFTVLKMAKEIADYEPEMAFKGGGLLGLNIVQNLIKNAVRFLRNGGMLIFEIGLGQGNYIVNLCKKFGLYQSVVTETDNDGHIRVIGVRK